ncbi:MAG: response regulator [Bacteroidetes bacterium]|nr:response regulator [Bacteroidota bacterium]MBK9317428.1 response regulator [Bacteroidota bacterium]
MSNEPLRILLADDDEADRLLFKEAISELKIKTVVHSVNDGVDLMEALAVENQPLPQLLFLDLNMPRKDGMECLKEIRANDKYNDISIAIFSTSGADDDMEETFLNGANVYIHKPNDFGSLKKLLERAVQVTYIYQEPPFSKENFLMKVE